MQFSVLAEFFCGFAVLRFWMIFSSVLRFLIYSNAPLTNVTFRLPKRG